MRTSFHNQNPPPAGPRAGQRASILVVVMWIVFGLISITLYFSNSMIYELRTADNRVAEQEAYGAIEAARRYITCVLSNLNSPGVLPDPQSYLREGVQVGNAKFWLIGRTNVDNVNPTTMTFSLTDEAAKLPLNSDTLAGTNLMMLMPKNANFTLDICYNIMAWRSTNTTDTNGGAESDTYLRMQPPYTCKNAPFETVNELRLVYQVDMDMLYGEDGNLNGFLDPNENDGGVLPPSDNADGILDPGLLEYVTVYSHEPMLQTNGQPRINVATAGLPGLSALLTTNFGTSRANQILAAAGLTGRTAATATFIGGPIQFFVQSQMTPVEYAQVEAAIMGPNSTNGVININTASTAVLSALPGMDLPTAQQIVAYRQTALADPNNLNTITWLAQALQPAQLALIGPWITGRTWQVSADIAAVGHNGRGYRRVRYVFDTSSGVPVVVYREDLSNLGWALGKQVRNDLLTAK